MIKKYLKYLIKTPSVCYKPFKKELKKEKLIIADVGSTGGPDLIWEDMKNYCHFLSFDPDQRAISHKNQWSIEHFQIGLWSEKKQMPLHLTSFPSASTVYSLNFELLNNFANAQAHELVGISEISLDAMENVLKDRIKPNFIKIDAEGADLEILKGAEKYLQESCLGIFIEVSFSKRHINAPLFGEVDLFLQEKGFFLADLSRSRWVRKNKVFGINSRPQIIWGNALYFINKQKFLSKMDSLDSKEKSVYLTKLIMLLIQYRFHDYAIEIIQDCLKENYIDNKKYRFFEKQIKHSVSSSFLGFFKLIFALALALCIQGIVFPFSTQRSRAKYFLQSILRKLSAFLLNLAPQGPNDSDIADE